ncbi:MAG: hypothetical protein A3F13_03680 [Gammaproteobacteria bacterium RIFCSPHIGHO2_12_FULL_40_19]|nr:MAG: hypothetical protein A3F13_03680 [Gammaproteobacteria bacterium RIFCSPHIGHO2_12_FULL_40_19]
MTEVILEKEIRFSQSMMWKDQKKYYDVKGIDAWDEDVPFYITSNPFIARGYAQIAIGFIQDWISKNPQAIDHPFYFLELGAGTGQFSFYFLKNLLELQKTLKLEHVKIQYMMSDVTESAFKFWESNLALQPFLDSGVLDFCLFDIYQGGDFQLYRSKEKIGSQKMHNPLVIIANYLFDSIATDVFTINNGELFESVVTLKTDADNLIEGMPKDWKNVRIDYSQNRVGETYYGNAFDELLLNYRHQLMDTHFQFPIASLSAIKSLQTICNNQFLLLTSDKGYTNLEELDHCDYPELDFHGSFSVMVNYHAIGEFLKKSGGENFIQSFRENIVSGVFSSGFSLNVLPQLAYAAKQMIQGFSPTDYFLIYEHFTEHYKECSLEVMSSYLNLSAWDPYVFDHISDHLCELSCEGDPEVVSYLAAHMHHIAANFYHLPTSSDTLFNIGLFFQNISRFEEAIEYYAKSQQFFGESDVVLFNIGMCLYSLDRNPEAMQCLQSALALNSSSTDIKEWLEVIKKEM